MSADQTMHDASKPPKQMTPEDARRIQSAADKKPQSPTAKEGFKERAQGAADARRPQSSPGPKSP